MINDYLTLKSNLKLTPQGQGAGRKVYIFNEMVLKQAKNKRGKAENQNEYYLYNNVRKELKRFLCPVVEIEGNNILMVKAEPIDKNVFDNEIYPQVKDVITKLFEEYSIDDYDMQCSFNWGLINNRPVLIDYGHNYFGECLGE